MRTKFMSDLIERTAAAYALAFLGLTLAAGFDLTNLAAVKAAGLAAIPAGLQVIYSAVAAFVGNPNTAGFTNPTDGRHAADH